MTIGQFEMQRTFSCTWLRMTARILKKKNNLISSWPHWPPWPCIKGRFRELSSTSLKNCQNPEKPSWPHWPSWPRVFMDWNYFFFFFHQFVSDSSGTGCSTFSSQFSTNTPVLYKCSNPYRRNLERCGSSFYFFGRAETLLNNIRSSVVT